MKITSLFMTILCCTTLVACGTDTKGDTAEVNDLVQPQGGNWNILTTGWTNDDCNATEYLNTPDILTISDVNSPSFGVTFYVEEVRIADGSSTCTHSSDDTYSCEEFVHTEDWENGATTTMTGLFSVNVLSETTVSGSGDLVMNCTGLACTEMATYTNSGSYPCVATINFTAEAE